MTNEQDANALTHHFATIGSRTECGGWAAEVVGKTSYRGRLLVRVGDIVKYDDGSEAVIIDGAGFAAALESKPFALVGSQLSNDFAPLAFVGSELDNGDAITDSPEREGRGFSDSFTVVKPATVADQEAAA
ncbi:hypothetical protein WJ70_14945 [Burkholderia ubonensis]|uniref:hypothetical protein n=1 Tax=Burkholderia ubonensis TaxID=101571 RepID=UPI0007561D74|nr:hypothetical protein [Burkholderia ubonensis]KVN92053.1 hypothetical protein WJ70_14945 [Burkholderia ubonensis]